MLVRPCSFDTEGQAGHWWRLFIHIVNSNFDILGISDNTFLLTPSGLEVCQVLDLLDTFDRQPAWSLDSSLQNEQFQHALIGAK